MSLILSAMYFVPSSVPECSLMHICTVLIGRGPEGGLLCSFHPLQKTPWKVLPRLPALQLGWQQRQYWRTIQVVRLRNKLYLWGRGVSHFRLFEFCTRLNKWNALPGLLALGDLTGWAAEQYNDTLQLVVVGEILYVWGRGKYGCVMFSFDTTTNLWASCASGIDTEHPNIHNDHPNWLSLPDHYGWDCLQYFHTIRVVVVGLSIYVWARGESECRLHSFDTQTKRWEKLPSLHALSDIDQWNKEKYFSTLQVAWLVTLVPCCRDLNHAITQGRTRCSPECSDCVVAFRTCTLPYCS